MALIGFDLNFDIPIMESQDSDSSSNSLSESISQKEIEQATQALFDKAKVSNKMDYDGICIFYETFSDHEVIIVYLCST